MNGEEASYEIWDERPEPKAPYHIWSERGDYFGMATKRGAKDIMDYLDGGRVDTGPASGIHGATQKAPTPFRVTDCVGLFMGKATECGAEWLREHTPATVTDTRVKEGKLGLLEWTTDPKYILQKGDFLLWKIPDLGSAWQGEGLLVNLMDGKRLEQSGWPAVLKVAESKPIQRINGAPVTHIGEPGPDDPRRHGNEEEDHPESIGTLSHKMMESIAKMARSLNGEPKKFIGGPKSREAKQDHEDMVYDTDAHIGVDRQQTALYVTSAQTRDGRDGLKLRPVELAETRHTVLTRETAIGLAMDILRHFNVQEWSAKKDPASNPHPLPDWVDEHKVYRIKGQDYMPWQYRAVQQDEPFVMDSSERDKKQERTRLATGDWPEMLKGEKRIVLRKYTPDWPRPLTALDF